MEVIMPDELNQDVEIASILTSTKKKLGPAADYNAFDHDILVSINSAFATLYDVCGLGGDRPCRIVDDAETWDDVFLLVQEGVDGSAPQCDVVQRTE